MNDPIMMAVDERRAVDQMHIEATRKLTDSIERLNDKFDDHAKTLHSIDTRLTRIEARGTEAELARIWTKVGVIKDEVDTLKADKSRRDGAVGFLEWLARFGPWLLAFALAVLAFVGWGQKG